MPEHAGALAPNGPDLWKSALTPSPVFSVGNLAMGGRGKTPVVAYIARWLVAQGERPAILSRGYGRSRHEDGVVVVSDGVHVLADVDRSGDEPFMLARSVPGAAVLVCDVRSVARALAERSFGATVHVLDDGFQHRALAREVDLVLIAPEDLRDRRAPFGRLREPVSALARASAVIVDGDPADAPLPAFHGPVFSLTRSIGRPAPLEPHRGAPTDGDVVVALAGIAAPARFSRALEARGWRVGRLLAYRDHHRYGAGDLERMAAAVRETGATGVLTTEKDAMRLLSCRPLPVPVAMVPLEIDIQPSDRFTSWLRAQLAEARR